MEWRRLPARGVLHVDDRPVRRTPRREELGDSLFRVRVVASPVLRIVMPLLDVDQKEHGVLWNHAFRI